MNYFAHRTAAQRYACGRPYFHPLVINKIKDFLDLTEPVSKALDVGCGTGKSTIALKDIAVDIVGTDISKEMLQEAPRDARIEYIEAPAEDLPFPSASFDLITVAVAFHWFDRRQFLHEAYRLLRPRRWLVIYSDGFSGTMKENPEFERWNRDVYLARYPTPPRNYQPFGDEEAKPHGFQLVHRENYTNEVTFAPEEFVQFLMTQTNVIAAVEQGSESSESVHSWLTSCVAPLFTESRGTFPFGGDISYLQKL